MDEKIEKDIINCSRCALCADVCPLYSVKPLENKLLRGKMLQLLGVIRGDIKYSGAIKASIDECLGCGKCETQCPSALSASEIFSQIKFENLTPLDKILSGKILLKFKLLFLKILYTVKHPVKSAFGAKNKPKLNYFQPLTHFNGCLSKCINTDFSLPYVFKEGDFNCCGVPYKTKGNLDEYRHSVASNVKKINDTNGLIVFNCATCLAAVRSYRFQNPKTKERLVFYTDVYKNFLKKYEIFSKKPVTVTFHTPCHLKSAGVSELDIESILKNIKNVTYKKLENPSGCCGFSGDYFTRHFKTADILSTKKADDIINSGADIVLTSCPTCLWSLKYGLKKRGCFKIKALDLAEFLSSLDFTEKL